MNSDEKKPSIDALIADLGETKREINITKLEAQKVHKSVGNFYYENERLEKALEGAIQNLGPLSGHAQSFGNAESSLLDSSRRLRDYIIEKRYQLQNISAGFTDISTTVASGSVMLANSANIYSENIEQYHLPPIPPSIQKQINPYVFDQEGVEEELIGFLQEIDKPLRVLYSNIRDIFKTPHQGRLDYAASEMRKLVWEILRKLAPHEKVSSSVGFTQDPGKDAGVPTYRQQVAYILTGAATMMGPKESLISSVFVAIDHALGAFSSRIKAFGTISDEQIEMNMAACERAILTLLKNRKV
jgi:hypothetical protein